MDSDTVRGPRAVARALELLMTLSKHVDGLTLAQLTVELEIAKPTLLDTLRGLCDQHYLAHADGRYRLGSGAYRLAGRIIAAWSPPEALRREVKELADLTRESVGYAIADWEFGQVIYTEAINSTRAVRYAMHQGIRAPLYASAAGRVILAYSDPTRVDSYLARATLRSMTTHTRTSIASIRKQLAQIRNDGFCASFGEMLPETAAVAGPVFGHDSQIMGAIMLASPIDRMRESIEHYRTAVLQACRKVSAQA